MELESNEIQLLLACSSARLSGTGEDRIKTLVTEKINWADLIRIAAPHGLLPLLHHNLSLVCEDRVPPRTLEQLRRYHESVARRNAIHAGELFNLLDLLEANHIPAIPFKGPTLGLLAYGDLSLREFTDLDIAVHENDLWRTRDVLERHGYVPEDGGVALAERKPLPPGGKHWAFKCENRLTLEIHWRFGEKSFGSQLEPADVWSSVRSSTLSGRSLQVIPPEQMLVLLSIHLASHQWRRLNWICDITAIVNSKPDIDWEVLLRTARRVGCERMLLVSLLLSKNLLGSSLPRDIDERSGKDKVSALIVREVSDGLFTETKPEFWRIDCVRYAIIQRERQKDRFQAFITHVLRKVSLRPNSADAESPRLPTSLSLLHYITRPMRLWKAGIQKVCCVLYPAITHPLPGRDLSKEKRI
jgi:putative nucleotidyltransferase-like protein